MKKDYTIAVAGTGYVGLSIATLLSQHHKVMAVDIVKEKVDLINNRKSPIQDNYEHTVDYSIMRVIEIFYSFVKEPVRIDNLIVTHKYICDVWKNGSKHLYFYTLHNQEHAIVLIQNIVKLINTIDFLKISSIDYYEK